MRNLNYTSDVDINTPNSLRRVLSSDLYFNIFLFFYLAGLVYLASIVSVGNDEVFSLNTSSYGLSKVIQQSYNFEAQPPAYFVLLSLWRKFDDSLFFARIFSVVAIGITIYFIRRLIILFTNDKSSQYLLILFMLNPFVVWAGIEARLYAMIMMLSSASLYCFFLYYVRNRRSYLIAGLFINIIALYTMYFIVFLLASLGLALLVTQEYKKLVSYILFCLPVAFLFLYNLLALPNPVNLAFLSSVPLSSLDRINLVMHVPQNLLFYMSAIPFPRPLRWVILAMFCGIIFPKLYIYIFKNDDLSLQKSYRIAFITVFFSMIFYCLFFVITKIEFNQRHLALIFPLLFIGFTGIQLYPISIRVPIILIISVYFSYLLILIYRQPVKEFDLVRIFKYTSTISRPEEPVCFYEPALSVPFLYKYKGANAIIPIPDSLTYDRHSSTTKIRDTIALRATMENLTIKNKSFILITTRIEKQFDNDPDLLLFNRYMNDHYKTSLDTIISGWNRIWAVRVRRMESK